MGATDANGNPVNLVNGWDSSPAVRRLHNVKAVQSCQGHKPADAKAAMGLRVSIPPHLLNGPISAVRDFIAAS